MDVLEKILAGVKVSLAAGDFPEAIKGVQKGLELFPDQFSLLIAATDVYRACGDREKSLHYSGILLSRYPEKSPGYIRMVQDLVVLKRFQAARTHLSDAEKRFTDNLKLLVAGTEVSRALDDRDQSLVYSERLLACYPDSVSGYIRSAQDLLAIKKIRKARRRIQLGLSLFPGHIRLQALALDVSVALKEHHEVRHYAQLVCKNATNVARSDAMFLMKHLIKELRNRRDVDLNWPAFIALLEGQSVFILKQSNLKWLKSICDTLVDHDDTERRLLALSMTVFINMLRVAEMVKISGGEASSDGVPGLDYREIHDGLFAFSVKKQDALLNLARRINWSFRRDKLLLDIWDEVVSRLDSYDNVIKMFSVCSESPERYGLSDPTGVVDNYGLRYEDLYRD